MPETKVVRVKKIGDDSYDVYIGRPSRWGNPFKLGRDGTREEVIDKYEVWIKTQKHLMTALSELEGKRLGCWCAPLPCHGDVLIRLINEERSKEGGEKE